MVNKNAIIVVGLGYGDEGKGLTTDFLCIKNKNPLVIRYNGGHQAGHCVVTKDGKKHIFSNFGSGTLRGVPTYWSSYCTFEPLYFLEELNLLKVTPKIYIDNYCLVTTHYDILYNRALETTLGYKRHGSCGVGFGATIDRSQIIELKLLFKDIFQPEILLAKLKLIREYYRKKINLETAYNFDTFSHDNEDIAFIDSVKSITELISRDIISPVFEKEIFLNNLRWNTYIFEGAQGILLDKNFGVKPYITKSNTTSQNALAILERQKHLNLNIEIFYVTRAYQTRHGAGPFREINPKFSLYNNSSETNITNDYQGKFRCNYLDLDLLNYAIKCDMRFSSKIKKNLMLTCLDQIGSDIIHLYKDNKLNEIHYRDFAKQLLCDFESMKFSFSNCAELIG